MLSKRRSSERLKGHDVHRPSGHKVLASGSSVYASLSLFSTISTTISQLACFTGFLASMAIYHVIGASQIN